jgi:hypothetical protein
MRVTKASGSEALRPGPLLPLVEAHSDHAALAAGFRRIAKLLSQLKNTQPVLRNLRNGVHETSPSLQYVSVGKELGRQFTYTDNKASTLDCEYIDPIGQ